MLSNVVHLDWHTFKVSHLTWFWPANWPIKSLVSLHLFLAEVTWHRGLRFKLLGFKSISWRT